MRLLAAQGSKFVVGDPNQAIYSWRGANPTFMNKRWTQDEPLETTLYLADNYRWGAAQVSFTNKQVLEPCAIESKCALNSRSGHTSGARPIVWG